MPNSKTLLQVTNVHKSFGGLQALTDVSIAVSADIATPLSGAPLLGATFNIQSPNQEGAQIYGLIGPNGAGKTTLFNIITGLYEADDGAFVLDGQPYSPKAVDKVVRLGIARTFQNIRLFNRMTALENVLVGFHTQAKTGLWGAIFRTKAQKQEEETLRKEAQELLDWVGIGRFANHEAQNLSYGDQRRLEIARALATHPKLLALDEPAAGMNSAEKKQLQELLRSIAKKGIAILLIEHDVKLMMNLCQMITVLDYGKVIAQGPPDVVKKDPAVIAAYLGKEAANG